MEFLYQIMRNRKIVFKTPSYMSKVDNKGY